MPVREAGGAEAGAEAAPEAPTEATSDREEPDENDLPDDFDFFFEADRPALDLRCCFLFLPEEDGLPAMIGDEGEEGRMRNGGGANKFRGDEAGRAGPVRARSRVQSPEEKSNFKPPTPTQPPINWGLGWEGGN